jgi:hypothetical protein
MPKTPYTIKIHLGVDLLVEAASVKEAASIAKEVAFRKRLVISVERDEDIAAVEEIAAAYLGEDNEVDEGPHLKHIRWHIGKSRFDPKGNRN